MTADDLHHDREGVVRFLQQEHEPQPPRNQQEVAHHRLVFSKDFPLDPNQTLAATHLYGPMRVLAPAGSGKTRTLVSRIVYLLEQGIAPDRILALAFNRKAQQEMDERLHALGHQINVRTFHSFGYEVVRHGLGWEYQENSGLRLMDLLQRVAAPYAPASTPHQDWFVPFQEAYHRATMELVPLTEIRVKSNAREIPFQPVFEELLAAQAKQRLLTFDGMIYFALRVLLDDASLRHRLQNQFEFVLVDEFQDLNRAQMLLTQLIALPQNNLFVVGDDDQMIYGWRGADVRLILDFPQLYPEAKTVVLATNYRSTRKIVQHSRRLIEHNPERVAKDIQPRPHAGRGILDVILAPGLRQQAKAALDWVEIQKAAHQLAWEDFAILYRANHYIHPVLPLLEQRAIPYTLAKDTPEKEDLPPDLQPGAISLMTIHKAKGKEFPFVVYFNLSQSGVHQIENQIPEERRVAYVGATRARQGLLLTADEEQYAPFLLELALNPEFRTVALPYLERQAALAQKAHARLTHQKNRLAAPPRFLWWPRRLTLKQANHRARKLSEVEARLAETEERLAILETEIRFRKVFQRKEHAK